MKNKKIISILLVATITGTTLLSVQENKVFATENQLVENLNFNETITGFTMEYDLIEDGSKIHYIEESINGIITTKKYINENENLKLIEELNTKLNTETDEYGNIIKLTAEIYNITQKTVNYETIIDITNKNNIQPRAIRVHPHNKTYRFAHGSTGHVGFNRLTHAAITGAITTVVTGGTGGAGAIAGIATLVMNGGYSNLYYKQETYYATAATGKNKPTWKRITKFYYDRNRTKQCGNTVYRDSTILTK